MDNDPNLGLDDAIESLVPGFDDNEGRVKMSVAEELVARMPYKPEYDDPLGDF